MEKKQYMMPQTEVEQVAVGGILMTSIFLPIDPAPQREPEVF